jgi:polar amino acid transport system substrate-binding protein
MLVVGVPRVGCALLILAAVVLGAGSPAGAAGTLDKVLKEKTLTIGYIPSPPGQYKDVKTGEVTGFYVDAARFISEAMGVKPSFIETKWATFAAGLQAGQFDLCIAATFATIPRALAVEFTRPIHYLAFAAAVRKGSPLAGIKAIADADRPGTKVAVVQGSAGHSFVKDHLKQVQVVALATADLTAPFVEVSAGRADIGVQDLWQVQRYAQSHPEIVPLFVEDPFNRLPISWSVRRGDHEFLNFVNTAIDYLLVNQKMEAFVRKYGTSAGRFQPRLLLEPADGARR